MGVAFQPSRVGWAKVGAHDHVGFVVRVGHDIGNSVENGMDWADGDPVALVENDGPMTELQLLFFVCQGFRVKPCIKGRVARWGDTIDLGGFFSQSHTPFRRH